MNKKRILGIVALPALAIAGMLLPLGLRGQTNNVGRVSLGNGAPVQPVSMAMPQFRPAEPSVAAYGTPPGPLEFNQGVGFNMTDPTSTALFGPQISFHSSFNEGLGFTEESFGLNGMIPWHVVPGQTVLMFDGGASVTDEGRGIYRGGVIYRNFDVARNRIFGLNAYYDLDEGVQRDSGYQRLSVGFETLGKYLDFTANGYYILGDESEVISSQLTGECNFVGHNIIATRENVIESAFNGFDAEAGGPLPFLGHYGINGYVGGYYLDNNEAGDTVGVSGRIEALINDATTANFNYTNDDLLGVNAWANLTVTLPRWRTRGWFKPRVMQERLADQTRRSNRIHTNVATFTNDEAVVNPLDGQPFELLYVDPNLATNGTGTVNDPFNSLEALAAANSANFDVLSVAPRTDNTSTNLSVASGLDLLAGQQLVGRGKSFRVFEQDGVICELPSLTDGTDVLDPLITNSTGGPGSAVVTLTDNNVVSGFRIDANGGRGIESRGPLEDFAITCNTIFNHTDGIFLNNVQGEGVIADNIIMGEDEAGNQSAGNGLVLSVAAGERLDLLLENNTITGHTGDGVDLLARPGSRLQANDPLGVNGSPTGILGNVTDNNGRGIRLEARTDAVISASVEDNQFNENTSDGFLAISDAGRVLFRSFARNTGLNNGGNGVFFQYRNGGEFFVLTEDANGNGVLDPGEDVNGNGLFDLGFVQNDLSGNGLNGLCIFGQGSGTGVFDIGGPDASLGNTFEGNADAGIAYDLTGTATAQFDILNNQITAGQAAANLTFVLDFFDAGQASFTDFTDAVIDPFTVTTFGFADAQFDLVSNTVLDVVRDQYLGIPTNDVNPLSPIPAGMILDIDFVIGETGVRPDGVEGEFYSVAIGDTDNPLIGGLLGISNGLGQVRDQFGAGPNGGGALPGPNPASPFGGVLGEVAATVYPNQINTIGGLTPGDALTSGSLEFTGNAIANVVSHEVGHSLSLRHVAEGAATPTGVSPIMGTGAPGFGQPNQSLLTQQEFSFSGNNPGELPGEAPFATMSVQQLVDAVGLRSASTAGASRDGIRVRASNDTVVQPSRIVNNTVDGATEDGIRLVARDNAVFEDIDVQGNTLTNNGGNGLSIEARDDAVINADRSIGGNGFNTLAGNTFAQGNFISGNGGDGIRVLAANGGTVNGNIIGNTITDNEGNGISLLIERFGTLNFGDLDNNQVVENNIITGNLGFGVFARTESTPGEITDLNLILQGNTISNNASGGFFAELAGQNTPPGTQANLDLTIQNELFDGNGGAGIAFLTGGNTKGNVLIKDSTITNTTDGTFGGDGIHFERSGSSLLEAVVMGNTVTNNFGDGLDTLYSGSNRFDPTQPMSGTINSVTWMDNTFSGNGGNGVSFRGRGDAQMQGDGTGNTISNNTLNGIFVDTREFSTFGDPSDGSFPPPGRRVVFQSNVITGNGIDGINLQSFDDSVQLVQVTSAASSAPSGSPHEGAISDGDTVISGNGSDGIHVQAFDNSNTDLLVDSGDGQTFILDNGVGLNGGNGLRFDAEDNTTSTVTIQQTVISGSQAGATEDLDGDGVLDLNGDNGNAFADAGEAPLTSEDASGNPAFVDGNLDIDVENGDGIQFNVTGNSTPTLQVGGDGLGNIIQSNEDDGIAITALGGLSPLGSGEVGQARPTINVTGNVIGGSADGVSAGNQGDGISLNVVGGAFGAIDPAIVQATPFLGRNEIGPIVTASFTENQITNNGRRGANFLLTGASGVRGREAGLTVGDVNLDLNFIEFSDNVVSANGEDGVFFQANARYIESRGLFLGFNGPAGGDNFFLPPYNPNDPGFLALNAGTLFGQSAYLPDYLSLRTAQNSQFEALDNQITNNGTQLLANQGTGMTIRVSPNAYLAADIQNTTFGGNLDGDFFTESFNVGGNPANSVDLATVAGPPVTGLQDIVFLDDTAQFDLRFENNTGNQIDVTDDGFLFTNSDPGKGVLNVNRAASLFQVDNGANLNNPNNIFSFQGTVQNIVTEFATGGFNLRAAPDPLFPNVAFPPFLP